MKLVAHGNGVIQCPLCEIILHVIQHKHQVAIEARHPSSPCAWSNNKYRVHPQTGDAERIKENVT